MTLRILSYESVTYGKAEGLIGKPLNAVGASLGAKPLLDNGRGSTRAKVDGPLWRPQKGQREALICPLGRRSSASPFIPPKSLPGAGDQSILKFAFSQNVRPGSLMRPICINPGTMAPDLLRCSA